MAERLEHVRVAQIPGFCAPVTHDAIVPLGRGDQARVLCSVEKALAVLASIVEPLFQQFLALPKDGLLAFAVAGGQHGTAVCCRVFLPWRQATVALARNVRGFWINLVEIL